MVVRGEGRKVIWLEFRVNLRDEEGWRWTDERVGCGSGGLHKAGGGGYLDKLRVDLLLQLDQGWNILHDNNWKFLQRSHRLFETHKIDPYCSMLLLHKCPRYIRLHLTWFGQCWGSAWRTNLYKVSYQFPRPSNSNSHNHVDNNKKFHWHQHIEIVIHMELRYLKNFGMHNLHFDIH